MLLFLLYTQTAAHIFYTSSQPEAVNNPLSTYLHRLSPIRGHGHGRPVPTAHPKHPGPSQQNM